MFFPLAGPCCTRQRATPVRPYIEVEIGEVCRGEVVPASGILFRCFLRFIADLSMRRLRAPPSFQLGGETGSQQLAAPLSKYSVFCISVDFSTTKSVLVVSSVVALTVRHSGRRPELPFFLSAANTEACSDLRTCARHLDALDCLEELANPSSFSQSGLTRRFFPIVPVFLVGRTMFATALPSSRVVPDLPACAVPCTANLTLHGS